MINEKAREKLLNEVSGLSDDKLNEKPSQTEWSIRQVLEHLYLMEGGIAKTIQKQLINGETRTTRDKPIERTVDRSFKVEAPDYFQPGEQFLTLKELLEKLSVTHEILKNIADTVPQETLEAKSYPHPVFGNMNLKQWIPFVGYHEIRHIEQIQEIKEAIKVSK